MPVDSIITTIITKVMVRMSTGSNTGMPNWNGMTTPNHSALPTLSKFIKPMAEATTPPMTMPNSTEILAMKPLAYFEINKIEASTKAAMPTPVRSAYLGLGILANNAKS